jgi:hypothetical protein
MAFHIPVHRLHFFEKRTQDVINNFLDAAPLHDEKTIVAIRTDFAVHHEDHELVERLARLTCYGMSSTGHVSVVDPKEFEGETLSRFYPVAHAFTTDDKCPHPISDGSILPWHAQHLADLLLGRLFSLYQTRHFSMFGHEYPSNHARSYASDLTGEDVDLDERRAFFNVIVPPVESNHERLAERPLHNDMSRLANQIYRIAMDFEPEVLPLAEIEWGT